MVSLLATRSLAARLITIAAPGAVAWGALEACGQVTDTSTVPDAGADGAVAGEAGYPSSGGTAGSAGATAGNGGYPSSGGTAGSAGATAGNGGYPSSGGSAGKAGSVAGNGGYPSNGGTAGSAGGTGGSGGAVACTPTNGKCGTSGVCDAGQCFGYCDGMPAALPAPWTSTEPSSAFGCVCNPVGCCVDFDQCFTQAGLDARLVPGWKDKATPADFVDGCPVSAGFAGLGGPAECQGHIPNKMLAKQGDLCCYSFSQGGCCGRPIFVAGAARVSTLASRRDWGWTRHGQALDT